MRDDRYVVGDVGCRLKDEECAVECHDRKSCPSQSDSLKSGDVGGEGFYPTAVVAAVLSQQSDADLCDGWRGLDASGVGGQIGLLSPICVQSDFAQTGASPVLMDGHSVLSLDNQQHVVEENDQYAGNGRYGVNGVVEDQHTTSCVTDEFGVSTMEPNHQLNFGCNSSQFAGPHNVGAAVASRAAAPAEMDQFEQFFGPLCQPAVGDYVNDMNTSSLSAPQSGLTLQSILSANLGGCSVNQDDAVRFAGSGGRQTGYAAPHHMSHFDKKRAMRDRGADHVLGVHWDPHRRRWYAMWYDAETGKKTKRSFSIGKYGTEKARELAIEARRTAMEQNADYGRRNVIAADSPHNTLSGETTKKCFRNVTNGRFNHARENNWAPSSQACGVNECAESSPLFGRNVENCLQASSLLRDESVLDLGWGRLPDTAGSQQSRLPIIDEHSHLGELSEADGWRLLPSVSADLAFQQLSAAHQTVSLQQFPQNFGDSFSVDTGPFSNSDQDIATRNA